MSIQILARARLQASIQEDAELLSKLTGLKIDAGQEAKGKGFKLTHAQDKNALDSFNKKFGATKEWGNKGSMVHRMWEVDGHKVCLDYSRYGGENGLLYLES
jgi:hypothetical protein